MDLYVIFCRDVWRSVEDLEAFVARLTAEGDRMPDDIWWIRSYVIEEGQGFGTVCIYEVFSPEVIYAYAAVSGMLVIEIIKVADIVVVRFDLVFVVA